jgi:hypothetical protein
MPSKEEKRRRAKLVKAIAQKERDEAVDKMPISFKNLAALFNHLDEQLSVKGCDHSQKITIAFLKNRNLNTEKVLPWLEEYGGYCDCEVLANVEDSWEREIKIYT